MTRARTVGYRASGTGAATADKETRIKDVGDSFGFSVRGNLSARMEVGAGFDWFRNTSSYPQSFVLSGAGNAYPTGATGPVPDVSNRLLRLRLDGKYAIDKTSEVRLDLIHERWRTNDWSWEPRRRFAVLLLQRQRHLHGLLAERDGERAGWDHGEVRSAAD